MLSRSSRLRRRLDDEEESEGVDFEKLENALKASGCIQLELVSGQFQEDGGSREFTWFIKEFTSEKLAFEVKFTDPDSISST